MSEPFSQEQLEQLDRIEEDLAELNSVLRILVWSKTGQWLDLSPTASEES